MILARNKDQPNVTAKIWFSFMTDIGDRIIKFHSFAREHIPDEWWEQETLPEIPIPWNIIYEMEGDTWQEIIKKLDNLIFEIKKMLGRLYDGKIKGLSNHWKIILSRDEFVETIYGEIKKRLNPPLESHPIRFRQEVVTHPPTEANVPSKYFLCPKCGKVTSDNSNRCSYCGEFIPTAYFLVTSTEDEKEERKLLEKLKEMGEAFVLQGFYDIIVKVKADSMDKFREIEKLIEKLPYVTGVTTLYVKEDS
jgi:DNA-binding Lrp family transcriptional regulator